MNRQVGGPIVLATLLFLPPAWAQEGPLTQNPGYREGCINQSHERKW